jgi:hypothetical protein
MKDVFWNSNGLRDLAKQRFLFEATREKHLDFIAILESKRNDFTMQELSHLCAGKKILGAGRFHGGAQEGFRWG